MVDNDKIDYIFNKIVDEHDEQSVLDRIDEEISDFIGYNDDDDDSNDGYFDSSRDEVVIEVVSDIIRECLENNGIDLTTREEDELTGLLLDEWSLDKI